MHRTIAVVGGTGPQGCGLAYRFAAAGNQVILGSRDAGRAREKADEINQKLGSSAVGGAENVAAIGSSDIVLLAVPWEGHTALVTSLAESLTGKIVISCVNPLALTRMARMGLCFRRVRRKRLSGSCRVPASSVPSTMWRRCRCGKRRIHSLTRMCLCAVTMSRRSRWCRTWLLR